MGIQLLPRVTGDHSEFGYWLDMADGKLEGLFVMGQNPAVGASNGRLQRNAMKNLKWLVVRDMVETETASFWKDSPEVERGELNPEEIGTEVFFMPAAGQAEKSGSFTNTQRLLQWHNKAIDPPGGCAQRNMVYLSPGALAQRKGGAECRPGRIPRSMHSRGTSRRKAKPGSQMRKRYSSKINGWMWDDKTLLQRFEELKPDGSTASGCWIYTGVMPARGRNRANERESKDVLGHGWGFAWPKDTRIIYNRASARPDGAPWSEEKKLIWWDEQNREWTGHDITDFKKTMPPDHKAELAKGGLEALDGDKPFGMHPDGRGWLYVSSGLKDGPMPAHFEPLESPVRNPMYPGQQDNPPADKKERPDNSYAKSPDDPRFPFILTTYRLTEHHTAGGMSRGLGHLAELQPELFAEISPELARGQRHRCMSGWVTIVTPRGLVSAKALVTARMRPLQIDGRTIHQVGLPYHWGWKGIVTGDVVNDLLAISEEPNVRIMEIESAGLQPRARADASRVKAYWTSWQSY